MKVIVTGDRRLPPAPVFRVLDLLRPISVVCGDVTGADQAAREWARRNKVQNIVHKADWSQFGNAAGPIRNKDMLERNRDAAVVIAFPRGGPGTRDCMKQARAMGFLVLECGD